MGLRGLRASKSSIEKSDIAEISCTISVIVGFIVAELFSLASADRGICLHVFVYGERID